MLFRSSLPISQHQQFLTSAFRPLIQSGLERPGCLQQTTRQTPESYRRLRLHLLAGSGSLPGIGNSSLLPRVSLTHLVILLSAYIGE